MNTLLKSFMKQNSGISAKAVDVNADSANSTVAKIQTLLLSGGTDIIEMGTVWPFFAQDLLIDLTDYFKKDNWRNNYLDAIYTPPMERLMFPAWVAEPSKYISAPGDLQTLSLAYDAQLFEDFGVEPPGDIPDIDDIVEKMPKLTGTNPRTGKKCYGTYFAPVGQSHIMLYYLGHGLDVGYLDADDPSKLTIDTPTIKASIEGMISLAKYCPPGFNIGQGIENWGTENNTVAVYMSVGSSTMLPAVTNKLVDRFVVTKGVRNTANHTYYVAASEYAISSKCKDPDAAWEVVKFLSGADGQKYVYTNYLDLPSWKAQDWVNDTATPYAGQFMGSANAAKNAFLPEFIPRTLRPWIGSVVTNAMAGKKVDLDAGLADMQKKAEQWVKDGASGLLEYAGTGPNRIGSSA